MAPGGILAADSERLPFTVDPAMRERTPFENPYRPMGGGGR